MSTKRGSELGVRLERIRKLEGFGKSLRSFWVEIGGDDVVSYEGCRNYHGQTDNPRDPSAAYLRAVVMRFRVNPMWLLTGDGPEFWEDLRRALRAPASGAEQPLWAAAVEAVPEIAEWPLIAKVVFVDVVGDYLFSFDGAIDVVDAGGGLLADVVGALSREVYGMASVTYTSIREDLTHREFGQYMVALLHAIQLRIPGVGEGPHIFTRFKKLDPEHEPAIRKMMEGTLSAEELDEYLDEVRRAPLR
jgi:hypothetical protein